MSLEGYDLLSLDTLNMKANVIESVQGVPKKMTPNFDNA